MNGLNKAYQVLQDNSGLKVGDTVKVLRAASNRELGWDNNWTRDMDNVIGTEQVISHISEEGKGVRFKDNTWNYPFFILEKLPEPKPFVCYVNRTKAGSVYAHNTEDFAKTMASPRSEYEFIAKKMVEDPQEDV